MTKKCNKCKEFKLLTEFFKDKNSKDGVYSICKECKKKAIEKWRKKNRKKYNSTQKAYNNKNYKKLRLQRYRLSLEDYEKMLVNQNNKCKTCGCEQKGKRPLVVDHCHTTGKVRGLLCYNCNRGMHYIDNEEFLQKALEYKNKA